MGFLWLFLPFFLLLVGVSLFAVVYRQALWALWCEPVLRQPVLIIESDDWGPAPPGDVPVLERLVRILSHHRDHTGHPAVMTLGLVLAVPDGALIRDCGLRQYYRQPLVGDRFKELRQTFLTGVRKKVFSLQLHGMEHFWPESVMAAARKDSKLQSWLTDATPLAEQLPDALQSRWCDCSLLPCRNLDKETVRQASYEEAISFSRTFGNIPAVAVPPTFIWNDAVEDGWARAGVRVIISPGRRLDGRDSQGRPVGPAPNKPGGLHLNGMHGQQGLTYLIRNAWFEPNRGHTAQKGIDTLASLVSLGRPVLFETHRSNFIGGGPEAERAFGELDALLKGALQRFPRLRFCASEHLAERINTCDAGWIECSFQQRLTVFLRRVLAYQYFRRPAVLTGTFLIARIGLRLSTRWPTTYHTNEQA